MKRVAALLAALLGGGAAAQDGGVPPATPPGFHEEVLPNGLRVSVLADPAHPVVAVQVWIHVGAANEEPKTRGFAHLFEHLMFGPTTNHAKQDYPEFVRRHGGRENAYTSWDETVYVAEIPPAAHLELIAFEADRMVNLALNEENLANEQRIVTEELRLRTENDPFARVGVAALKAALGEHPYAVSPAGTKEDIAAASLPHARGFYARFYKPRNAHLVIVGPVDAAATLARVRERFGPLPASGETPPDVPPLRGWKTAEHVRLKEDLPPVEVAVLGYMLPEAGHPDRVALDVLGQLLAGGKVDPFREELVVARHRALEAGTLPVELRRGGALFFFSAALPYRREATAFRYIDETLGVLGRYAWLTDATVAAAKRSLLRGELQAEYFAEARAQRIGQSAWWEGDSRAAFARRARLEAVTRADVQRVYERYVKDATPVRLYLQPERVPLWIRAFGWLAPLVIR